MTTENAYEVWEAEVRVLADIGRAVFRQRTRVSVRLPRQLAELAVAAWKREDHEVELPEGETLEQRTTRLRAGTLALIGLAIEEGGTWDDDGVIVEIDAWHLGGAFDAADDAGLLKGVRPSEP